MVREGHGAELYDSSTQLAAQREFAADADIRRGPLPYIHPPFEALIFLPLTLLSYKAAFLVWNLINLGILLLDVHLLRNWLPGLQILTGWQLLLIALAFFPIFANFHQGQDAILLLTLVILGMRSIDRGALLTAGCWLGCGVFKYHLVLPLLLMLAVWKGRRLAIGFLATAAAAGLASVAMVGWKGMVEYPAYAWHVISMPGFGRIPYRQLPNLMGLLGGWPLTENGGWLVQLAVFVCSAGLIAFVLRMGKLSENGGDFALIAASSIIAALLVGYSTNTYDLALLVVPLALIADDFLRRSDEKPAIDLILPAVPLLCSPLWFYLWLRWGRINLIAVLLLWWVGAMRAHMVRQRLLGVAEMESRTVS